MLPNDVGEKIGHKPVGRGRGEVDCSQEVTMQWSYPNDYIHINQTPPLPQKNEIPKICATRKPRQLFDVPYNFFPKLS